MSVDDRPPVIVSLPAYSEESNKQWQQDILRNAALTSSEHRIEQAGRHGLNVWAVDPGVVIDGITLFSTQP